WKSFSEVAGLAEGFIQSLEKDHVKQFAIRKWCAKLIADNLIEMNKPLVLGTLTWQLGHLPEVMDSCFPGYLASGHMGRVLELLYRGSTKPTLRSKR
ncbi:MAG: hypothetical protein ACREIC_07470, partial [Limisphaerales bacterium]